MKMKNLLIGLCMIGGVYTSAATAEVIQDCVLTGKVVNVSQVDDTMRVNFYDLEHGELATCMMKRRAKRGRVAADMTTSGLEIPRGSKVTYAFQQTRSESKWQLLEVQRPVLLSSKL
ncbi:MAG TPA: hypothetical protein DEX20_03890 [Halieaceae bacterium]|nr:hypothetical protein [Halieaceae bacterium]